MVLAKADRRFRRLEPYLGTLISTGVFTLLGKQLTIFGNLGWPESTFLGVFAASVLTLTLAAGLAAWRYFRPLTREEAAYSPDAERADDIAKRLARLEHNHGNLRDHFTQAEPQIGEIAELKQRLETLAAEVAAFKLVGGPEEELRKEIGKLAEDVDLANRRIVSVDQHVKNEFTGVAARIQDEADKARRSFYALQVREVLADLEAGIQDDAMILYDRLAAGEIYDREAWDRWENVLGHWNGQLNAWLEHGKWYAEGLLKKVLEFPDSAYRGQWTITEKQFPDAEAVRQFKRHRIIHSQWLESRSKVREGTQLVAFTGLSDTEVRRGKHPDQ